MALLKLVALVAYAAMAVLGQDHHMRAASSSEESATPVPTRPTFGLELFDKLVQSLHIVRIPNQPLNSTEFNRTVLVVEDFVRNRTQLAALNETLVRSYLGRLNTTEMISLFEVVSKDLTMNVTGNIFYYKGNASSSDDTIVALAKAPTAADASSALTVGFAYVGLVAVIAAIVMGVSIAKDHTARATLDEKADDEEVSEAAEKVDDVPSTKDALDPVIV
ncbi:hypothetical protein SPRG_10046 [Saprolegnia parasitica CBS 223.65]|uniref:Uncharacterized protein n=1 Tax=Saprolegnia parasitica (strain CBS 223.65) TaxID=695850 RepID=A0A067CBI7_SAPPC|nr:hypothetical protein SPRG_10046 [Saprolegnia parasitica CBS 223.65]KDO23901.1 hypothetical protein SPRG_10046 [Saprolegnia parasitica CBS 223.65]|eukprot:XP_012205370.1 hypothetical protein SPRG_10046 [Saprolegnia parasitica CBS 223.65]